MNLRIGFFLATILLLVSAHRLPAPISEAQDKPRPSSTPADASKPKAAAKNKEVEPSNSARRFNGTWRRSNVVKNQSGSTLSTTSTLVIQVGSNAKGVAEATWTLGPGATWQGWAPPYNSFSPVYVKSISESKDLTLEGSNLKIRWPSPRLSDWKPKTIPAALLHKQSEPATVLSVLNGSQLIATDGKTTGTWDRVQ